MHKRAAATKACIVKMCTARERQHTSTGQSGLIESKKNRERMSSVQGFQCLKLKIFRFGAKFECKEIQFNSNTKKKRERASVGMIPRQGGTGLWGESALSMSKEYFVYMTVLASVRVRA